MGLIVEFVFLILTWFFRLILFALLGRAILGWLIMFGVVNPRGSGLWNIRMMLEQITEPIIAPFRRFVPSMGGIDLAFSVAFLVIYFISERLIPLAQTNVYGLLGGL